MVCHGVFNKRRSNVVFFLNKPFLTAIQHIGALRIEGPDAASFLQGQLTCDVSTLTVTQSSWGACCDPKGRALATFFLWRGESAYYLLLPKNMLDLTLTHLKKYIFRANVNLQIETAIAELISPIDSSINENIWRLQNIEAGFVWIYPETRGLFIPQMLNLQKIGGVSFKKGCYVGQEIIARTENLGQLKRHLYQAKINTKDHIKLGDALINADKQTVGTIVECAPIAPTQYQLLAVLQDQLVANSTAIYFNSDALQALHLSAAHEKT